MARKVYEISFNIAGRLAGTFIGAFSSASSQMKALGNDVKQLKSGLRSLEEEYKKSAISVQAYQAAHQRMSAQLEKTLQIQQRLSQVQQRQNELNQRADQIRSRMIDTAMLVSPFIAAVRSAMEFENAMLGVAKQVQGARDEQGRLTATYYEMQKHIQLLGRELPIPTSEIARMVEAGARMNVPKEHLIDFTREVAKMSAAFEMPADQIGEMMGKIANVMQIPIEKIGDLADTINYLDDNSVAKGQDIIGVMQRIGGVLKQVNMNAHQGAALASTFLSLGKSEEVAATAANALIRELAIARQQPERFQNALKKLGMTAEEVNQGMVKDAQGTILKVLDAINKLDKSQQTEVTTNLFGKEYGDDVAAIAGAIDEYRRQLALLNEEQRKSSMDREFQARMQTTTAKLQLLKNSATEVSVSLGSVLLPGLNQVFGGLSRAAQGAAEFAQKYPGVTNAIVTGVTYLVGASLAWMGLRFVWTQVSLMAAGLSAIITRITAAQTIATTQTILATNAMRGLTLAQQLLNIAMRLSPIGMVITAIGALIGVIVYLYNHFESVRQIVNGVWDAFKATFPGAAQLIEMVAQKVGWLAGKLKAFWQWISGGGGDSANIDVNATAGITPHASGGIFDQPHVGLVAEAGPEAIIPLNRSKRSVSLWRQAGEDLGMSGGGTVIHVNYSPVINGAGPEIEPILQQDKRNLVEQLEAILHQRKRVAFSG